MFALQVVRQAVGFAPSLHAYPPVQSARPIAQVPLPSQMGLATSLRVLQNELPHEVPALANEAQAFMPLHVPPHLAGMATMPPSGGLITSASPAPASLGAPPSGPAPAAPPAPPAPPLPPEPVVIDDPAHSPSGSIPAS